MIFDSKPKREAAWEAQYAPFTFCLPKNLSLNGIHEFFIWSDRKRSDEDGPERILQIFRAHGARLISVSSQPLGENLTDSGEFVMSCVLDLTKIDCQVDDLLILVRKLRFVSRAERSKINRMTLSNFFFPPMLSSARRAVIMEAESLLALECSQTGDVKLTSVSAAFFEEGRRHAMRVVKEFIKSRDPAQKQNEQINESIKSYMRICGWGIFRPYVDGGIYTATITEPPTLVVPGSE
ncbi:MAG: hypothetical protein ACRDF4_11400, partial [Rhabdochlamydiaceae bacterium]